MQGFRNRFVDDMSIERTNELGLSPVKRAPRVTLQEVVYRELKEAIMAGVYPEGRTLTVKEVSTAMSTSHMPVREAMRRLVAERGLENLPNGTVAIPEISLTERSIAYRARVQLETMATALAVNNLRSNEIDEITDLNNRFEDAMIRRDWRESIRLNKDFHFAVYRGAHSDTLMSLIESLWIQNGPYVANFVKDMLSGEDDIDPGKDLAEHRHLLKALRRRDQKAAMKAIADDLGSAHELDKEAKRLFAK